MRLILDGSFGLLTLACLWACSPTPPSESRTRPGAGGTGGTGGAGGPFGGASGSAGASSGGEGGSSGGAPSGGTAGVANGGSSAGESAGGAGGAGASGGSAGGGAVCPPIFACDDFEATAPGAVNATKWTSIGNVAPQVVEGGANSSSRSVTVPSPDTVGSFIAPSSGFPPAGNAFYLRARGKFANATSSTNGHNWFIVGATAPSNGGELRLGVSLCPGKSSYMLDLNLLPQNGAEHSQFSNGFVTGDNPADFPDTGFTWEANTWYCFEAYFGDGEFRVWVDNIEVSNLHATDWNGRAPSWSVPYNVGKIGAQGNGQLGQVWWDDVAYSLERIGCDCACP